LEVFMSELVRFRRSILAALGLASVAACGGSTSLEEAPTSGVVASACKDPKDLVQSDGSPSGFVRCADGAVDHVASATCADPAPVGDACKGDETNLSCKTDADCKGGAFGRCIRGTTDYPGPSGTAETYCGCEYGCATDADCGAGKACACGVDGGRPRCVVAGCKVSGDCASGECALSVYDNGCGTSTSLVCRSAVDTCRTAGACDGGDQCAVGDQGPGFACVGRNCAIGRPMTVDGVARRSTAASRDDWRADLGASVPGLAPAVRSALAARWTEVAALEHASIGSFARFSLQLLALGAPPVLLAEVQQATLDEIEHAKVGYALASLFSGTALGPGPLAGAGAAIPTGKADVVRALVMEACVGETLGVADARALAGVITHAPLRAVHARIADDEERHAMLAWRALAWLVRGDAAMGEVARAAMEEAIASLCAEGARDGVVAPEVGLASAKATAAARRAAAATVVRPCMAALLAELGPRAS
jgi:hypothetical protein